MFPDHQCSPAGVCSVAFQVENAKVLIPTTGLVPAEVINAAMDLRLIVNPAAGTTPAIFPSEIGYQWATTLAS